MSVLDFGRKRARGEKISMVTCYDWSFARLLNETAIDAILVGDSAAMVIHGHKGTPSMPLDAMVYHVASVVRGAPDKWVVADLPFGWAHRSADAFMDAVGQLVGAGAGAVKIEGVGLQNENILRAMDAGIPVMGHIGLTPQHVHRLGGYRVQGREEAQREALVEQARALEDLGCFACVLECVVPSVTAALRGALSRMPLIGIGAGGGVDGQILVLHDLLGLGQGKAPRFVRAFADLGKATGEAISAYVEAVRDGSFPGREETYKE